MAENEDQNEEQNENGAEVQDETAVPGNEEPEGPNFSLQRIYLKDASYEAPTSPRMFQGQWQPKLTFDIKSRSTKLQDDVYEVVLILTVEAKQEEAVCFLVEVQQAAVFSCKGFDEQHLEQVLATVCPNIIFPYGREAVDALVIKGSFPPLMLAPVNFEMLYAERKKQEAERAAGGNGADSENDAEPAATDD